jgi:hypothetical protein
METPMTKEQYIEAIIEAVKDCNDLDFLDLIYRIAMKSVAV